MRIKNSALRITIWYLLAAGGWVMLSHLFPAIAPHSGNDLISTAHLMLAAAVVITALLLYLVLRYRFAEAVSDSEAGDSDPRRQQASYKLLAFAIVSTMLFSSNLSIDELLSSKLKQNKSSELAAIAETKEEVVSSWLQERLHDAALVGRDYDLALHYARRLSGQDSEHDEALLQNRLRSISTEYGYSNVILLDNQALHAFSADAGHADLGDLSLALARQVAVNSKPALSPLYRDGKSDDVHIDFIAPLLIKHDNERHAIGAVLLHASAEKQLYSLINRWPIPSSTAETLLVKVVEDNVVFLNPLRHTTNRALEFTRPLSEGKLIAAMALRGEEHVSEGVDYRGIPVLAATRRVAGTPWIMVAKVDQDEVYQELSVQRWMLALFSLLLLCMAGGAMILHWRRQQQIWLQQRYREVVERKALRSHYEAVLRYANDIFILTDARGNIVDANERAAETTGYSHEELLSMTARQLRSPHGRKEMEKQWQFDEQGSLFETEWQRKDGSTLPVEVSARFIEVEGKRFRQGIIRDISERKQAEQAILVEKRFSETLIQSLPDALFLLDHDGSLLRWNNRLEELYGLSPEEMPGTNSLAFVHNEDRVQVAGALQQALDSGSATVEARLNLTNGLRHYRLIGNRIETEFGESVIGLGVDITERKQAEKDLLKEKELAQQYLDIAEVMIMVLDSAGNITLINKKGCQILGYTEEEMLGRSWFELCVREDMRQEVQSVFHQLLTGNNKVAEYHENTVLTKNGTERMIAFHNTPVTDEGVPAGIISSGEDITERKQAEEELRQSEARFRNALDNMLEGCQILDFDCRYLYLNDTAVHHGRLPREAMIGHTLMECYPGIEKSSLFSALQACLQQRTPARIENCFTYPDGSTALFQLSLEPVPEGVFILSLDITDKRRSAEAIKASRDLLRSVMENIPARVFWKDRELRYLGCNTAFAHDTGMKHPKELYGKDDFQMGWKDQAELYRADDKAVMESGKPRLGFEEPQTTPEGNTIWLRTSKVPLRDDSGEITGILGIYEDITAEKQTQDSLRHLNRALKTLSAGNHALVRSTSESQLWHSLCRAIVEEGGYLLAWVGYARDDEAKSVQVMASHAVKPGYTENIDISWDDVPAGHGPTGTAIRTGRTRYVQNIADNPTMEPWRETALAFGYRASIALPLRESGKTFGALTIYAGQPDAFNVEELALLEETAEDLSYGIHMQRTAVERDISRAEQQHTLEQMQQGLVDTVAAMAATVEIRDPYTAGHQRRVADLAVAIAGQLDLDEQRIQGIFLAGIVHDLGKINIPSEILSKPGKLSELEYQLIMQHPQSGYDILKGVKFPWPIAQTVLQHHERLDGSGYPQGLKGEQILLEAKIMAVADVVEAMSSHRPYRAGLGIDPALAEIERNRGKMYEPDVVDACLKLFREQGYKLESKD